MRKLLLIGVVSLPLLFLLSVYATPPTTPTWTVRLHASHNFQVGDSVEEAGQQIGQIVEVIPYRDPAGGGGTDLVITLAPPYRDRVREHSTFVVKKPSGSPRPVLILVVFDEHSPVLPPGSRVAGAESEMELGLKRQMMAMENAVRVFTRQLEDLRQTLDQASRSEEKQRLENSVSGLIDTLRQTRDDLTRVLTQELAKWKKFYDKLFPPEREKPVRMVS
jgi:ABC-type transporter Mla subunit MlaD